MPFVITYVSFRNCPESEYFGLTRLNFNHGLEKVFHFLKEDTCFMFGEILFLFQSNIKEIYVTGGS